MHAVASVAVATALTQEMRLRETPHRNIIAPVLYAGAVMPALARVYSHDHPDNRIDRAFLRPKVSATIVHDARGFSLMLSPF